MTSVERSAALVALAWIGCAPAGALVQVEDPDGVAFGADELRVQTSARAEAEVLLLQGMAFPVTFTLTGDDGLVGAVRVGAWASGAALAVGEAPVRLSGATPSVVVSLAEACARDLDCSDGAFCTGEERCQDGRCVSGPTPCGAAPGGCGEVECDEEAAACEVRLPEGLDDRDPCTEDLCRAGVISHAPVPEGAACVGAVGVCRRGQCVP